MAITDFTKIAYNYSQKFYKSLITYFGIWKIYFDLNQYGNSSRKNSTKVKNSKSIPLTIESQNKYFIKNCSCMQWRGNISKGLKLFRETKQKLFETFPLEIPEEY